MHIPAAAQTEVEDGDNKELSFSTAVEMLKNKLKYSISLPVLFLYSLIKSAFSKVLVFRILKIIFNFIFLGYFIMLQQYSFIKAKRKKEDKKNT